MRSVFFFLIVAAMALAASASDVELEPGADAATAEPAAGEKAPAPPATDVKPEPGADEATPEPASSEQPPGPAASGVELEASPDVAAAGPAAGEEALAVDDTTAAGEAAPAAPRGYLERATFATAVVDREPWDSIETLTNDHLRVAYFTEVRGMAGGTILHRWEHGGKVMAEVSFAIGAPRWRVYSTKNLDPSWLGDWTVSVIDAAGNVLSTDSLTYTEAPAAEATPAEETEKASASAPPETELAPPAAIEP